MRVCTGLVDFRPTLAGIGRPKPVQPCGWSLGHTEQRHDVPKVYALQPKCDNDVFCISTSTNRNQASLLWEEDLFQFEFENDISTSEPVERPIFKVDELVSDDLKKSKIDVSPRKRPGMLQMALKQSAPMEVICPRKHGDAAERDIRMSIKDVESQIHVPAVETQSQPIVIPRQPTVKVNSDHSSTNSEESFLPPHMFATRMNNDNDLLPNSYRPRGLASLRQRTAVLSQTGYLDGYTEMGQKPRKVRASHRRNAFSA